MTYSYDVESSEYAWLRLKEEDIRGIKNPLVDMDDWAKDNFHLHVLKLMRNPRYMHWTVKSLLNINLLPEQVVIMQELWNKAFPMYIASRGYGKSFLLAVYATLRCLLIPESKIVIVGAAFRQSKVIFEYMEVIWRNAPILQSLCADGSGPRRDVDRCTMKINDSWTVAVPLGTGEKIRGLRAHTVLADEFNSIPIEIYETVVAGFASVSKDPVANVREAATRKAMKAKGEWTEAREEKYKSRHRNQSILTGTAGYDFEPYAGYWKKYKKTIHCRGDLSKINDDIDEDDDESVPEYMTKLDWKEFCVVRIPYELIPEGFMDDQQVSRSRATMHTGTYIREYGACLDPNTLIQTTKGVKKIIDIQVGDLVLTHKGRFRKVTKKLFKRYQDKIVKYKTVGYNKYIGITPNHPCWIGDDNFVPIGEGIESTNLVNLNELSGKTHIEVEDIVTDILETLDGNYLYTHGSQSKINIKEQREIRENKDGKSQSQLGRQYNVEQASISYIQTNSNVPKNRIPKRIPLSYDFGLIIGYYASEGSVGAKGRSVGFALDEHKDTEFQKQLLIAIRNVFGFQGKRYVKAKNVVEICINSRLVGEIMKHICPGVSATKLIDHDIMFSNEGFLRGVIESYWNGDGHIRECGYTAKGGCVNQSLLNQIRLGLSYFNIASSSLDRISRGGLGSKEETEVFILNMHGNNFRKFMFEIYGKVLPEKNRKQYIVNDDEKTIFSIKDSYLEDYDGLVYNLEVEEDNSYSTLNSTVHNCFAKDSQGFFKRTLIEACVAHTKNMEKDSWPTWCDQTFNVMTRGNKNSQYVFGIDPASEIDNFAIIVMEIHPEHQRVVYSWTTNRKDFMQRKKLGLTEIDDYYSFCIRKIRDLMQLFPCISIGIDLQGGGYMIAEGLRDPDKMRDELHEQPILEVIDENKEKETDRLPGLHILEFINFASAEWNSKANNGLRKDLEDKFILFPQFDQLTLGMVSAQDEIRFKKLKEKIGEDVSLKLYDTLEDIIMDIEDLKAELCTIVMTRTDAGREKFNTPEIKLGTGKKGRMRKDRYSALVIANMIARSIKRAIPDPTYSIIGKVVGKEGKKQDQNAPMYVGQEKAVGYTPGSVMIVRRNQ